MTAAAALPALALPAVAGAFAQEPDPVFALIDKARALYEAHGRSCEAEPVDADGHLALDAPEYTAWDDANEAAGHASCEALDNLLATPPTTREGMGAVVRYFTDIHPSELGTEQYRILLDSLNAHFAA